ncbi:MAG TPA: type II toxin-antitoxin system VapC family toxin [Gemmataceae bacterium]|jgi:predicted nucleic acid-binding protein|nr:type II toxin-antitoxin system VapC family toxin [Gemmataceae bacterium]
MAKKGSKKKAREFILDCSVTMAWYFKDEANAYAKAVRRSLSEAGAVVPALWPLEVANILVLGERRQRSTEAAASKWLSYLQMLPIHVDDETAARAWSDILHVARSYDLSAYDASYLELAIRLALPLASLDDKLKATAASAGVAEFKP